MTINKSLLEFVSTSNVQEVSNNKINLDDKKLVSINYLEILIKFNDYFINKINIENNNLNNNKINNPDNKTFLYTKRNSFRKDIENIFSTSINKKKRTFHSSKCNCNGYFCSERTLCYNKYGNTKCTHCSKFY